MSISDEDEPFAEGNEADRGGAPVQAAEHKATEHGLLPPRERVEPVRFSWPDAYMRLQDYLTPDQAEAPAHPGARGYVTGGGCRVTADPARRYQPDEFARPAGV